MPAKQTPGHSRRTEPVPGAWRRDALLLVACGLAPLAAQVLLFRLRVPLGCPGRLVYEYSPVVALRLASALIAVVIGLLLAAAVSAIAARPRVGLTACALLAAGLSVWTYAAPPAFVTQHTFNSGSPAQDGAFVVEALGITDVRAYLAGFPDRARTPPDRMRGTRVISNPPGATLLAAGAEDLLNRAPALRAWITRPHREHDLPADAVRIAGPGLLLFMLFTALWAASGLCYYAAARLFVAPSAAAALALCVVFSTMTFLFTPGKDPAQLLTVGLPLWLWLHAYVRGAWWSALLAGAVFVVACLASLVHIWIAAIVALATIAHAARTAPSLRPLLVRLALPAAGGAVGAALLLYAVAGLNVVATARAVARSQADITRGPDAMPLAWQLLGVPLFLLLAGPALWMLAAAAVRPIAGLRRAGDEPARLGRLLLLATGLVMLGTIGFTNIETPRLWIPFVPLLLLGLLLQIDGWRAPRGRSARLLGLIVGVQIAASALQWSLMDPRETEHRVIEERYFDRPYPGAR